MSPCETQKHSSYSGVAEGECANLRHVHVGRNWKRTGVASNGPLKTSSKLHSEGKPGRIAESMTRAAGTTFVTNSSWFRPRIAGKLRGAYFSDAISITNRYFTSLFSRRS